MSNYRKLSIAVQEVKTLRIIDCRPVANKKIRPVKQTLFGMGVSY